MSLMTGSAQHYRPYNYRNQVRRRFLAFFLIVLFLFLFFLIADHFFISAYEVRNTNMEPYLSVGDRVLATPLLYGPRIPFTKKRFHGFNEPRRGDIVIARAGFAQSDPVMIRILGKITGFFTFQRVKLRSDPNFDTLDSLVVKRVLGIPGDTVIMEDYVVYIKPEGNTYYFHESEMITGPFDIITQPLPEGWKDSLPLSGHLDEMTLGPNQYFLIGDNRSSSLDSRHWGPVPKSHILKKVILKYWPFREFNAP